MLGAMLLVPGGLQPSGGFFIPAPRSCRGGVASPPHRLLWRSGRTVSLLRPCRWGPIRGSGLRGCRLLRLCAPQLVVF